MFEFGKLMKPAQGAVSSGAGKRRWWRWWAFPAALGIWVGACGRAPLGENPIQLAECGDAICAPTEDAETCEDDCFCGDGICSEGESIATCDEDCPRNCGNGACNEDETIANCPLDCARLPGCGDGNCRSPETEASCPADCSDEDCDNVCDVLESCENDCRNCGNGRCNSSVSPESCPEDCEENSFCGDGRCAGGENQYRRQNQRGAYGRQRKQ